MSKYNIFVDNGEEKQIDSCNDLHLSIEKIKDYMRLKGYPREEYNLRVHDSYILLDFGSKSTIFKIKSNIDLSQELKDYKRKYSYSYSEINRNLII